MAKDKHRSGVAVQCPGAMTRGGMPPRLLLLTHRASEGGYIAAMQVRPSSATPQTPEQMVTAFIHGVSGPGGGKVDWQLKLNRKPYFGREVQITTPRGIRTRFQVFGRDNKIVAVGMSWKTSNPEPKSLRRYLQSLTLPLK